MQGITYDYRVLGSIGTNVYLVINNDKKECILFDPADEKDAIVKMIEDSNAALKAILLTHGHYDHIMAAREIADRYGVSIYAGEYEADTLNNTDINLSGNHGFSISLTPDKLISDGETLNIAGINIKALHTPGHTKGSMCYYIEAAKMLISGDTLFAESVGRTDFPGGSMSAIVRSVKEKLFVLPEDTKVFPGHGEGTSIGYEKKYNPYCM